MCFRYVAALGLSFCSASLAHADEVEIFLSKRAAEFDYARPIDDSAADVSAGLFYNKDSDLMLNGGLTVSGQPPGELPFSFGAGAKAYAAHLDDADEDIAAIALADAWAIPFPPISRCISRLRDSTRLQSHPSAARIICWISSRASRSRSFRAPPYLSVIGSCKPISKTVGISIWTITFTLVCGSPSKPMLFLI